jgi:hypothetical protein
MIDNGEKEKLNESLYCECCEMVERQDKDHLPFRETTHPKVSALVLGLYQHLYKTRLH